MRTLLTQVGAKIRVPNFFVQAGVATEIGSTYIMCQERREFIYINIFLFFSDIKIKQKEIIVFLLFLSCFCIVSLYLLNTISKQTAISVEQSRVINNKIKAVLFYIYIYIKQSGLAIDNHVIIILKQSKEQQEISQRTYFHKFLFI